MRGDAVALGLFKVSRLREQDRSATLKQSQGLLERGSDDAGTIVHPRPGRLLMVSTGPGLEACSEQQIAATIR
jgi:hypothetical protein